MIDTHCHLASKEFENDFQMVIENAKVNGIDTFIVPSTSVDDLGKIIQLSNSHDEIYFALGIHPHNCIEYNQEVENQIRNWHNSFPNKMVAIGEIGLDYYYNFHPNDQQIDVFRKQLCLAKELGLPAIVHNRDSDEDLLRVIREEQDSTLNVVLHCFSGTKEFLQKALELGCYVSFTGNVTFKNSKFYEIVYEVPNDKFFLETDCPYMTPHPHRGKRNEPKFLKLVAEKVAQIKNITFEEVAEMTTRNAKRFFKLISLILIALNLSFPLLAQGTDDDEFDEEEYFRNLYHRSIGFGPEFGFNTIVVFKNWTDENGAKRDFNSAWEGKFFWGAHITYSPFDFMIARLEYTYTKDLHSYYETVGEQSIKKYYTNIYRITSASLLFIPNPNKPINFFGGLGGSFIANTYNLGHPYHKFVSKLGANGTIGFIINIPIQNVGLFNITGEWFMMIDLSKDVGYDVTLKRDVNNYYFYSMPRVSLTYYPKISFK